MRAKDHLTLQLVQLRDHDGWPNQGQGFSFVLVKDGRGQYISSSAAQNLSLGDVLILNSTDGGTIAGASDVLAFWHFSVCIEHLLPLCAVEELCLLRYTIENLKGTKRYDASSPTAQECHQLVASAPPQGNVEHRSQLLRVAAVALSEEFKNMRCKRIGFSRMEDHMSQVFEELTPAEIFTLSVEDLAQKFGCTRRHLNRLFHQYFGCSIAGLRMEIRLLKTLSLLRDPAVKIIDVADQCGFNHLGLFNACFKKRFGNTPGMWRRSALNVEEAVSDLKEGNLSCVMRERGLCPWPSKPDDSSKNAGKATLMQGLNRTGGPADPNIRGQIMRDIREVSARMRKKLSSGIKLQDDF